MELSDDINSMCWNTWRRNFQFEAKQYKIMKKENIFIGKDEVTVT